MAMADQALEIDSSARGQPRNPAEWIRVETVDRLAVGIADGAILHGGDLRTSGLGSCVAVAICAPDEGVGGLIHPMLPHGGISVENRAKYVDTAVADLVATLEGIGIDRSSMVGGLVGGATMFSLDREADSIGERNASAAEAQLAAFEIPVQTEDVGGSSGRTATVSTDTGEITVRTAKTDSS